MLTIIFFIASISTNSTPNYEQLAVDYFFDTIWKEKYGAYKAIEFDNRTDSSIFVGYIYRCPEWTKEEKIEIEKGQTKRQIDLTHKQKNVSVKRTSQSRRLKLFIGTSIKFGETNIVQIRVYKPFEFVEHYFIKFDTAGKIIDKCEFGEIITEALINP
ncbi:MAG: hypothetical protein WD824_02470 [Cyclobacteriaceae bacterium]